MRKVKLQLDALQVESFQTAAASRERGTVDAHMPPRNQDPGGSGDIFCISAYPCVPQQRAVVCGNVPRVV